MKLFAEKDLSQYLSDRLDSLRQEVRREGKNQLLNVNEIEYVDYLVSKYSITPLNFQWELMSVTDREEQIPAERFPTGFNVWRGQSYPKQVLTFHIPFIGEQQLLSMKPSTFIMWTVNVNIQNHSICLNITNFYDDSEQIKSLLESEKRSIQTQLGYVLQDVERFNFSVRSNAESNVQARKNEFLKMDNLMESLGVPIQKAANVPTSFSIPLQKSKPIIKPTVSNEKFEPEPALDETVYRDILKILSQMGVEMERHPSIYFDKDEEALRDHFLMVLSPHFQSVTGETFNKKGKTDILIRHEQSNVFVAECKFWRGEKSFHATIKQILSYLTWRDSKAAIICFLRNKDIESVITQVKDAAQRNDCFVAFNGVKADGWLDFDFRLEKDNPRGVRLSVLCFHFPAQSQENLKNVKVT